MSDFIPNKLGFDVNGCMTAILRLADSLMSETADIMIILFKKEIDRNGNGSSFMKSDAKKVVREILHDVAADHITIEAGFDEAMARAMAIDFYVRTMVVIHGNQAGGPIHTKPGHSTWKKNVVGYGPSGAKTEYKLPQFDQSDASDGILENVMKDMEKYFTVLLIRLNEMLDGEFYGQFITGG